MNLQLLTTNWRKYIYEMSHSHNRKRFLPHPIEWIRLTLNLSFAWQSLVSEGLKNVSGSKNEMSSWYETKLIFLQRNV